MPTGQLVQLFQSRSQACIIAFDEQFVPITNKDILKRDIYIGRWYGQTGSSATFFGTPKGRVGIIFNESETLSGKISIYGRFDEELRLTIFAAGSAW